MPTAAGPNPPLHLVDMPADRVDWDRTERYADSARAGPLPRRRRPRLDYTALSNQLAEALNEVAATTDQAAPSRDRRSVRARPRRVAAESLQLSPGRSPADAGDARRGDRRPPGRDRAQARFNFNLVAFAAPPPITEPLLPAPTLQRVIEQVLNAARGCRIGRPNARRC